MDIERVDIESLSSPFLSQRKKIPGEGEGEGEGDREMGRFRPE